MSINTAQTIISIPGRKILQGKAFISTDNRDIGASATFRYGIITSAKAVHMGYTVSLQLGGQASLYRDSNPTGAIANDIFNMNETDTTTVSSVEILRNVGLGALGDLWNAQLISPGATIFSSSKIGPRNEEFILAPNTDYILEVINPIAALNRISMSIGWYDAE